MAEATTVAAARAVDDLDSTVLAAIDFGTFVDAMRPARKGCERWIL